MASIDFGQFHQTFFDEAAEHVRTLEAKLLELETNPDDPELHNALFRAAHSIKGASAILGFEVITRLTHAMENVLEAVRGGQVRADGALGSLLLEATDLLSGCVELTRTQSACPDVAPMVAKLERVSGGAPTQASAAAPAAKSAVPARWEIVFRPSPRVFANGLDPAFALQDLAALGRVEVEALLDQVPALPELDPESCFVGWRVFVETAASKKELEDVFLFMDDARELRISRADASAPPPTAVAAGEAKAPALRKQADGATLRVATEKVDALINLVGELVISQAMISRSLSHYTPAELPRLREAAEQLERHTRDLQERVMNIRMVPIGTIFNRFRRLVRDLSESLGKTIELDVSGEETELDKSMVELIADPLMHLVRNAADHGLEAADARERAGKPRAGRISLGARHQGGNVIIEISDDGAGLDEARILARAVERGLVSPEAKLLPEEIHELIFAPGFSTATQVTDLSGRGVGMDVVKRAVSALNGDVSISTTRGRGTRFRLTLPLTLAILDGMALRVGEATWVIPLSQVIETIPLKKTPVTKLPGRGEVIQVRGNTLALLRAAELLGVPPDPDNKRPLAVVCEAGETRFALAVDELLGKSQFVIKSLEPNFKKLDGLLGATILGDGAVSFILDLMGLARLGRLTELEDRATGAVTPTVFKEAHA
ncbi:MAG: chemotaxis protein CheA [Myxococcota bacterium]